MQIKSYTFFWLFLRCKWRFWMNFQLFLNISICTKYSNNTFLTGLSLIIVKLFFVQLSCILSVFNIRNVFLVQTVSIGLWVSVLVCWLVDILVSITLSSFYPRIECAQNGNIQRKWQKIVYWEHCDYSLARCNLQKNIHSDSK